MLRTGDLAALLGSSLALTTSAPGGLAGVCLRQQYATSLRTAQDSQALVGTALIIIDCDDGWVIVRRVPTLGRAGVGDLLTKPLDYPKLKSILESIQKELKSPKKSNDSHRN